MTNTIIQKILDGISIDELYGMIDEIPLQHIETTIRKIDTEFKEQLMSHSTLVHMSMESYHRMGSIECISQQFGIIKKNLTCVVGSQLPFYQRWYLSFVRFFTDPAPYEKLEQSITTLQECQHVVLVYTNMLALKFKDFSKYLEAYHQWITALTQFVPKIADRYGENTFQLSYSLSQVIANASEFLATQQQLESTITLQIQNNRTIMTDILQVTMVTKSLIQNTISAQHFFEQEYVGSVKILKKYTNKK